MAAESSDIGLTGQLRSYISGLGDDEARLPPERQLAKELSVSRSALRKSLNVLEAEGCLYRHVGRGTFVTRRPAIVVPSLQQIAQITNPLDVMEIRLIIEPQAARLSAMRVAASDLATIERCIARGEASGDIVSYEHWDGRFHIEVAAASRNRLLAALVTIVQATRDSQVWGNIKKRSLDREKKKLYIEEHRQIMAALRDRDPNAAERNMRRHLAGIAQTIQAALELG